MAARRIDRTRAQLSSPEKRKAVNVWGPLEGEEFHVLTIVQKRQGRGRVATPLRLSDIRASTKPAGSVLACPTRAAVTRPVTHSGSTNFTPDPINTWSELVELQGFEPWTSSMPWKV